MKTFYKWFLKRIFAAKGHFGIGKSAAKKVFDGVNVAAFKDDANAAVCISADFELNWAWRELSEEERNLRATTARKNFSFILELLDNYDVPITWATVGHLFLRECKRGALGLGHPDMPRPSGQGGWNGDWYMHDPCSNFIKDPLWYAPDLIEQIIESQVPHEIGTHSFSHIDFSSECQNETLVRREIEECQLVMEPFGLKPRSLVFPFSRMGYSYLNLLSDLDITAVRHRDERVRLSYPVRTASGIYKIYESMNLRSPRYYDYLDKAKIFIDEACNRQSVFHLWFHPSDPPQVFKKELLRIIEHISSQRNKGRVWVTTMRELAAYCETRETLSLRMRRKPRELEVQIETSLDHDKYGSPEITIIIPVPDRPNLVLLKNDNDTLQREDEHFFTQKDSGQVVLNLPVSAKSVRLIF